MRSLILMRCANGPVVWRPYRVNEKHHGWVCLADRFQAPGSLDEGGVVLQLQAMLQHSVSLQGAVQQVIQLAL